MEENNTLRFYRQGPGNFLFKNSTSLFLKMQRIRTIIVDDEEFAIIDLKEELSSYSDIEIIGEYPDGLSGVEGINELQPDLVFVDIEMPKLNGFEMLGQLQCNPIVIFCTGYSKYAIDGYAFEPTDFLLKPIKTTRFRTAMERAFRDLERKNWEERLARQKSQIGYLLLEFRDLHGEARKVFIWPENLLFLRPQENNANYIEYHLEDGRIHVVKKPLKKALTELEDKGFIQVHRQFIINSNKILELHNNDTLILAAANAPQIPISRGNRKKVKELIKNIGLH